MGYIFRVIIWSFLADFIRTKLIFSQLIIFSVLDPLMEWVNKRIRQKACFLDPSITHQLAASRGVIGTELYSAWWKKGSNYFSFHSEPLSESPTPLCSVTVFILKEIASFAESIVIASVFIPWSLKWRFPFLSSTCFMLHNTDQLGWLWLKDKISQGFVSQIRPGFKFKCSLSVLSLKNPLGGLISFPFFSIMSGTKKRKERGLAQVTF